MPSLAALAGSRGYSSTAFHPYKSSGWNRVLAYDYLGFDRQLYEEDVPDPWMIRQYISDQSDYEMIFQAAEEEEGKLFFFNVTMQNHSGYAQGWRNLERSVLLPERLKTADHTAEQFFALMAESDKALESLIGYFSQSEEPTLVVFFGDHQPPLTNAFYEELYGKKLSERTTQEVLQQYAVPFFLWANYDIEERQDVVISPNFLGVLTAQTAGLPLTGYMEFLSELYEVLPAITPVGFVTADGRVPVPDGAQRGGAGVAVEVRGAQLLRHGGPVRRGPAHVLPGRNGAAPSPMMGEKKAVGMFFLRFFHCTAYC